MVFINVSAEPPKMCAIISYLALLCFFAAPLHARAGEGKIIKVLPQFLDARGRASLSPSLYDRDAYQSVLLQHPEKRSGIQFQIHWKTKGGVWEPLTLRLELRGIAEGNLPKEHVLDQRVDPSGWLGHWSNVVLSGAAYRDFGEVTAWRVTLWEGRKQIGEQKSFLW
ncbi:MAG: hypothetical protein C5B50_25145 [Verrucomicrobia bacterium]|nr:MAG: hypothetical protein C5B50_25145 [Verrucomicrobiota bacterium]